ncbi:hypothetical protein PBNK5_24550 [Pectobacterium brasiliense]
MAMRMVMRMIAMRGDRTGYEECPQGEYKFLNIIRQNQTLNDFPWLSCYVITYQITREKIIAMRV